MIERLLTKWFKLEQINGHGRCPTYLYRWTLIQPRWPKWFWRGFGVYVHKFVADDWSLDLHDHPKRFISIGLKGAYIEVTPVTQPPMSDRIGPIVVERWYRAPWLRTFPANHVHRLVLPHRDEPCWTLVIVLWHVREWGFWHGSTWIPWRRYVEKDNQLADEMKACP